MNVERRLVEALSEFESVEPSPDLFRRVERSVLDDIERRRRVGRWTAGIVVATTVVVLSMALVTTRTRAGAVVAPVWALDVAETGLLIGLVGVFGPAIRRFGAIFVEEVFGGAPEVGDGFLRLLDVAYYLIFVGYIVITSQVSGFGRQIRMSVALEDMLPRLGGLLLLMGVIHAATLSVLPVIGLIHASTVRAVARTRSQEPTPPTRAAAMAERIVQILLWGASVAAVLIVLVLVALVPLGGASG